MVCTIQVDRGPALRRTFDVFWVLFLPSPMAMTRAGRGDGVKSSAPQEELRVDLLPLHTKASQLRRPGHLCRTPPGGGVRSMPPGGLGVPEPGGRRVG